MIPMLIEKTGHNCKHLSFIPHSYSLFLYLLLPGPDYN
jgi:hypothetical protein